MFEHENFLQLQGTVSQQHAERMSDLLEEWGALAVTFTDAGDQPILEPHPDAVPLWDIMIVQALFPATTDQKQLTQQLRTESIQHITFEIIENQDWQVRCQSQFPPLYFGERLAIIPSWHKGQARETEATVYLDPGVAFGTGTHQTTALCLDWLAQHVTPQDTLVDFGCGSGILSLAAIKLGAQKVWALDHDPQALDATRRNAEQNQISSDTLITTSDHRDIPQTCSIVVANILANTLIEIEPILSALCTRHTKIALAGILVDQASAIISTYSSEFELTTLITQDEWMLIAGICKKS